MDSSASQPLIRTTSLSRTYRMGDAEVHAVDGVDLTVDAGEFVAIVGVSGSGKSTLMHLLGGLDTPSSGEIVVDGRSLDEMSAKERVQYRREVVGFVFQTFHLVPHLTAQANVEVALTFQGIYGSERAQRAVEALAAVGLGERRRHRPNQLSGGEQQRVAVARAVVHRPSLLLADEPTANLDSRTSTELMQLFRSINRETGMTVLIVTHNEHLAAEHCDRIERMQDGRLLSNMPAAAEA